MRSSLFIALTFSFVPTFGGLILNSAAVDPSQFRLTQFANTGSSYSLQQLSDGSLAVLVGNSIQRFTDTNHDGFSDGPSTALYIKSGGFLTGLIKVGKYYAVGDNADGSITLLQPGATPADSMTPVANLNLSYPAGWEHNSAGLAARPTPGSPGSYDLVFNVGSEFDAQLSTDKVSLTGLVNGTLDGDSLYKVTINESGATPTAGGLLKVATGIRNVAGMQFAANGDFYFADNAIDGPGADGDEPPQAEELNRILASAFGNSLPDFGYPTCYVGYRTGSTVGSGCTLPLAAFQPLNNGTPLGSESEGPAEIAFSPGAFPAGFTNGIFIGFSGKHSIGPSNEENAIVYYDFGTGQYIHFTENGLPNVGMPIGLLSTSDALFISDLSTGIIYEITAAVPEPSTFVLAASALLCGILLRKHGQRTKALAGCHK